VPPLTVPAATTRKLGGRKSSHPTSIHRKAEEARRIASTDG